MTAPAAVAFDVIETSFALSTLAVRLQAVGLDGAELPLWFARTLRDAFAMAATGDHAPFAAVAGQALAALARDRGVPLSRAQADEVLAGFGELEPYEDLEQAFGILRARGIRIAMLTNGSARTTEALLGRAGLAAHVERTISIDEVGAFKPSPQVYRHAAESLGLAAGSLTLIAAHAWDVHGAKRAGLGAAFVSRGQPYPEVFKAPDLVAASLREAAEQLAGS